MKVTAETLNFILQANRNIVGRILPLHCSDYFIISMQASSIHYCFPRYNMGPWEKVELRCNHEKILDQWRETPEGNIYGYVPIKIVAKLINSHGGLI